MKRTNSRNVPWLEQMPSHWRVLPSKRLFSEQKQRALDGDEQLSATQAFGVIRQSDYIERTGQRVVQIFKNLEQRKHVEPDDFVISMRSFEGGLERAWARGCIRSSYVVLRPSTAANAAYYAHLFKSDIYIRALQATSHFIRDGQDLNLDNFTLVDLPLPPKNEQLAIARFLDRKTIAIDSLIAKKERLIDLLEEKRQALIRQAVTKGLETDVPMMDSGVAWIGKVPAHWQVKPVRYLFRSLDGLRVPVETTERANRKGDIPYYGASGIIDYVDDFLFDEPLVLVCEDGWNLLLRSQPVARALRGRAWVNNHAHVLRPNYGDLDYWAAAIEQTPFDLFVSGMRQPKLTADALSGIAIPAPPAQETCRIASFVREQDAAFSTAQAKLRDSADRLREYRQALITAAVTGRIDVTSPSEAA